MAELFLAANREEAENFIKSLPADKVQEQLLIIHVESEEEVRGWTALHEASSEGKTEVVKYLCSIASPPEELVFAQDKDGMTAMSYAQNVEIAQALVESVDPLRQSDFLSVTNNQQQTAFHTLASLDSPDALNFLSRKYFQDGKHLFQTDSYGRTPLHYCKSKTTAQLFLELIEPANRRDLIQSVDNDGCTVLHISTKHKLASSNLIGYLCSLESLGDELSLVKDKKGRTALHYAQTMETAKTIIESVSKIVAKRLVLSTDQEGYSALHVMVSNESSEDLVKYMCLETSFGDELALLSCQQGRTALHHAKRKSTAQILVESVSPAKRPKLLWTKDKEEFMPLHMCVSEGHTDVVKFLCESEVFSIKLLQQQTKFLGTPLHYVDSKKMAEILLEPLEPSLRRDLLMIVNEDGETLLHLAVLANHVELIEYLCHIADENLLWTQNNNGCTALFFAKSQDVAEQLVNSVQDQERFLLIKDEGNETALFSAIEDSLLEVVQYLCSFSDILSELLYTIDEFGRTPLHLAETSEVAQVIIEALPPDNRREYILSVDEDQHTILHVAAGKGSNDLVEYLCLSDDTDEELILAKDDTRNTAMFYPDNAEVLKFMVEALDVDQMPDILTYQDLDGNSILLSIVRLGRVDAVSYFLQFVEDELDQDVLEHCLGMKNKCDQNVFHLAAISLAFADTYKVLQDYIHCVDMEAMMSPDAYNNTPMHYVAAKYATTIFADFILHLPLSLRRQFVSLKNTSQTNCTDIVKTTFFSKKFFLRSVLCESDKMLSYEEKFDEYNRFKSGNYKEILEVPEAHINYDENILRVLKFALNEYSLLDSAYTISHTLFSLAARLRDDTKKDTLVKNLSDALCLFINYDELEEDDQLQCKINNMDTHDYHGKPKVVILESTSSIEEMELVVPGPDYIIVVVEYTRTVPTINPKLELAYLDINRFIWETKNDEEVKGVSVNSTLGHRYNREDCQVESSLASVSFDEIILVGEDKGRALIICNQSADRQNDLRNAVTVLRDQLGLEVDVQRDLTAKEMLESISEFSLKKVHSSIAVLSIMSHGADGSISDTDLIGECSVQEIVDSMCSETLGRTPKLIFLSFCRGTIGRRNRTANSVECAVVPWQNLSVDSLMHPVRQALTKTEKHEAWSTVLFPTFQVPEDCFICFSTLPDSKSMPGILFEVLSKHLAEIQRHSDNKSTQTIELVTLLTDLAGLVREKSRVTQYMNYCYKVNKWSKPVHLSVLKTNNRL